MSVLDKPDTYMATKPTPRILRMRELEQLVGLRRTTIYDRIRRNAFPKPVKLTDYATGWREDEIREWLESLARADG